MSEDSKKFRAAMRAKAERLGTATSAGKVDCSDFDGEEGGQGFLHADKAQGPRPLSRRAYKSGGAVLGAAGFKHGGRAARKSGGMAQAFGNAIFNSDLKVADKDREGHVERKGGMNKGGRTGKFGGGGSGPIGGGTALNNQAAVDAQAPMAMAAKQSGVGADGPVKATAGGSGHMFGMAKGGHPHKAEDLSCAKKLVRDHKASGGKPDPDEAEDNADQAEQKRRGGKIRAEGGKLNEDDVPLKEKPEVVVASDEDGKRRGGKARADGGPLPSPRATPGPPPGPPEATPSGVEPGDGKLDALIRRWMHHHKKSKKHKAPPPMMPPEDQAPPSPDEQAGPPPGLGAKRGGKKRAEGGGVYAPNIKLGPRDGYAKRRQDQGQDQYQHHHWSASWRRLASRCQRWASSPAGWAAAGAGRGSCAAARASAGHASGRCDGWPASWSDAADATSWPDGPQAWRSSVSD